MDKRLEKYCDLIVRRGVNIQKNQTLVINSSVETAEVVRVITGKAFAAGAGDVVVQWEDEGTDKVRYLNADIGTFKKFEPWNKLKFDSLSKKGAAFLTVKSSDPEVFKDVNVEKLVEYGKARAGGMKVYRQMQSRVDLQWCVCSAPSEGWALKVFSGEKDSQTAIKKLWNAIYTCSGVDKNDVFENWKKHEADLKKRTALLNKHNFKSLHYKNSLGTDLVIGLPAGHIWNCATSYKSGTGVNFSPNIPTEEIFTCPDRNITEGVVYGSKPFMFLGTLIEDFAVWFKAGKVVRVKAGKKQEALERLVSSFKNSNRLGEVALVPYDSPISKSGILFYNTLIDENASCHLAFGRATSTWVKDTTGKSEAELMKMGVNISDTHNDFMVGTKDMSITGIKNDGKTVDVFVNGNFTL